MDNVQGSIEIDSDSDDEIKPANLSDEFEDIAFVMPTQEVADNEGETPGNDGAPNNMEIMENVKSLVGMLEGNDENQNEETKENLVEKLLDENQTKKSFEMKVENDDDDEIFIVHEEDDDNQDHLFAEGAFQNFDDVNEETKNSEETKKESQSPTTVSNPFVDNLANSENLPVTQKLEVKINDDYLAQYNNQNEESESNKRHNAKIQQRKNLRGKKQNISIHQFDEATQKTIQDTVEQVRLEKKQDKMSRSVAVESRSSGNQILKIVQGEKDEKRTKEFNLTETISLVEDHVSKSKPSESNSK